jgi:hypothetical protein
MQKVLDFVVYFTPYGPAIWRFLSVDIKKKFI